MSSYPAILTYTSNALLGTGKKGILTPKPDGYYPQILGGLNVYNSAGWYYPAQTNLRHFETRSSLMRKVLSSGLRAEYGHPKRAPGQTPLEFKARCMNIYEENVCAHLKDLTLDRVNLTDWEGRPIIGILADALPAGPKGEYLKRSLDNPHENVCWSVRCMTDDYPIAGQMCKNFNEIITWDYVNEPGIPIACKWKVPTLESHTDLLTLESFDSDMIITLDDLEQIANLRDAEGLTVESDGLDVREIIYRMEQQGASRSDLIVPNWTNW